MTKRLVGKATTKPIAHPFTKLSRNPAVHPTFIEVIVKVIVESKANVINNAIKNPEYLLLIFKSANHPFRHFSKIIILCGVLNCYLLVSLKYEECFLCGKV